MKKLDLLLSDDYWQKKIEIAMHDKHLKATRLTDEIIAMKKDLVTGLLFEEPEKLYRLKKAIANNRLHLD